jgi:hypothetical protein
MKTGILLLAGMVAMCSFAGAQTTKATPVTQTGKPPARVRTKLAGFELSPESGKNPNQIGGASRDLGSPRLYAPNSGKAFSTHPVFAWGTTDANQKVAFRLTAVTGQMIYEATVDANHLVYPDDAPALTPGTTYNWTIAPEMDMMGAPPAPVSISIVSGAERDSIASDLAAATGEDGAAKVFVAHRLWYDAVAAYSALVLAHPESKDYYAARGTLYDQLPATDVLASQDWARVH